MPVRTMRKDGLFILVESIFSARVVRVPAPALMRSFSSHQQYRNFRLFLPEYQHIRLKIDSILGRFLIRQLAGFCLGVWR